MIKSKVVAASICLMICSLLWANSLYGDVTSEGKILLAENKKAAFTIVLPETPSTTQKFAGSELKEYLKKISSADFSISSDQHVKNKGIFIETGEGQNEEGYTITVREDNIILSGNSDRATLYAVYDFLNRLGCQWIAPDFTFYNGAAEYIPKKTTLYYKTLGHVDEQPRFTYRKLDVDQGRSHNAKNLKKIIDWMPKLRFNTLQVPLDYRGNGKVKWTNWREGLTPELEKRGLILEVGGHGYENFLNAEMEKGRLFEEHPDWFGKDSNCKPNPSKDLVFNTQNPEAVQYFINNVIKYLQDNPEIDVFDLWPPDSAKWSECSEWDNYGTPAERQARFINEVNKAIKKIRPDIRLQTIAYAKTVLPPEEENLDDNIIVDFCPINQSFEKQIYDSSSSNNANYVEAIYAWKNKFQGDFGVYSYFRKYAWHSLPNVIPRYIQRDMQFYANVPIQGISTYSEPGDWATYELNHYTLGEVAWDPQVNVDSLINNFGYSRYGNVWQDVKKAYALLENTVRLYGNIPFTELKSENKINQALQRIQKQIDELDKLSVDAKIFENIKKLKLMLKYAYLDLQIQKLKAADNEPKILHEKVETLVNFLEENDNEGLFLLTDNDNMPRFMRYYGFD